MEMNLIPQGMGGSTAVPFQRIIEPSQLGAFLHLEQAELLRIQRYSELWRFYFGKQWNIQREDGDPLVTINYSKLIVNKAVSWISKNGFDVKTPDPLKNVTLPYLEEVWKYNKKQQLLVNASLAAAVTGDLFFLVTYEEPTEIARRRNPNSRGRVRINLLPAEQVYPRWDPLNTDVLTSVRIETLYYDDQASEGSGQRPGLGREINVKRFTQILTPDLIIERYEGMEPVMKPNVLGEIPIVHIPNYALPNEFYGLSDLDGIIDLQRDLNEKMTDISDIIAYQAAPVTVITGAKLSSIERSARQIWSGLPEGATVGHLSLEGDLQAPRNHTGDIKEAMLEISETPAILLETPPISNTTGVALRLQYQPIIDKTARKLPFFQGGLEQINYLILRTAVSLGQLHLPFDLCETCGGRIIEQIDSTGGFTRTVRKCYRIDPNDFTFVTPDTVQLTHIRQHSFGNEVRESPGAIVEKEHGLVNPSAYDPEPTETIEERAERLQEEQQERFEQRPTAARPVQTAARPVQTGDAEDDVPSRVTPPQTPPPSPAKAEPPKLAGVITMPEEPEPVYLSRVLVHPTTGERIGIERKLMQLIPTGCRNPQYLDPYESEVRFVDALPRDTAAMTDMYLKLMAEGVLSKKWVRRNLDIVRPDEIDEIERELEEERSFEDAREREKFRLTQAPKDPSTEQALRHANQSGAGNEGLS